MSAVAVIEPGPSKSALAVARGIAALEQGADPDAVSCALIASLLARSPLPERDLWGRLCDRVRAKLALRVRLEGAGAAETGATALMLSALADARRLAPADLARGARQLLDAALHERDGHLERYVPMVWWEDGREPGAVPQTRAQDPVVSAQVLYALRLARDAGLDDPRLVVALDATTRALRDVLVSGRWREGTPLYPSPDAVLFFVGRAVERFPACRVALGRPLREAVIQRNASAGRCTPLEDAMCVVAAAAVGLDAPRARQRLLIKQEADGHWSAAPLRRAPEVGSAALTTGMAVAALSMPIRAQAGASPQKPSTQKRPSAATG